MDEFHSEFQMIEKLWIGKKDWMNEYNGWMDSHFMSLDMDKMQDRFENINKSAVRCAKELEANEVARDFKLQMKSSKI
jgi:dynein heavy chain